MQKLVQRGILLTSTRPAKGEAVARWQRLGYKVYSQSLLKVEFLQVDPLEKLLAECPQAIVLTSANAALALQHCNWDRSIPVYGVGKVTADYARKAGFLHCSAPALQPFPSAVKLSNWIKKNLNVDAGPIIFGCGQLLRHDIATALKPLGFTVFKIILYKTTPVLAFDGGVQQALATGAINSVVISSEQALQTFAALCNGSGIAIANFRILVLSDFLKKVALRLEYAKIEQQPNN